MNSTKLTQHPTRGLRILLLAGLSFAVSAQAEQGGGVDQQAPDLPTPLCDSVEVPAGNRLLAHVYALGVQIYQWNGSAWVFLGPEAELFADADYHGSVGSHYAGPTWEASDGSVVVAARAAGCTPDPEAIAWLRLGATSTSEHGRFARVTQIQRVNTVGGLAPVEPGHDVGEEAHVPYTAEYYLYRASKGH